METLNVLVVIDAQNDFITGALANPVADERVPNICRLIEDHDWDMIVATHDTHHEDYLTTPEGMKLPVPHCILNTEGWELDPRVTESLAKVNPKYGIIHHNKYIFGSDNLPNIFHDMIKIGQANGFNFTMCGFCTDICVVSNALILKSSFPFAGNVTVVENACAGVTTESHDAALTTMRMCQVDVVETL